MLRKCACLASIFGALILLPTAPGVARGQFVEGAARAGDLANRYRIVPNITYLTANNWDAKLDVYVPREATTPNPT
jgi:hypothetical protein